ncbi:MAG TPA: mandelate racemase/muconate lactonizing enzyme family protein [Alphaproteobacteria bacterium]|nr:mandelate racemase/muconate lactonizing enzyme family protein [Alphaproteobacteria bacterium]
MNPMIAGARADLLRFTLDKPVGGSGVSAIDVLAVDLVDADGAIGVGFSYGLRGGGRTMVAAARDLLDGVIEGASAAAPEALYRDMTAALNRLGRGPAYLAMAAIDLAVWDLHAKARGVSLTVALGGRPRPVPVYGSGGLRPDMEPSAAAEVALAHAEAGFLGVKPRLAGDRSDGPRLAAVRAALPEAVDLMGDANEKCDLARAQWLAGLCGEFGLLWLEEPLPAYDLAGYEALARAAPVPIATGEHLQGTVEAGGLFDARACAVFQPDLAMMGGMTECLRAARLAEHFGIGIAPHFLPALFVHLAGVAPNLTWLEDFPLLEPLFTYDVAMAADGTMTATDAPGHGLAWAEGARARYRADD